MAMLVIGCGNRLRCDDAAGPLVVERLLTRGLPAGVRCLDAGTAGVDAVLAMRGADDVVLVDACSSGSEPGTICKLTADEVTAAVAASGELSTHGLRWDQALAFGRAVLGDAAPRQVTVYLIEAGSFEAGERMSPAVDHAVDRLVDLLLGQSTAC
jgi:hydrogenase maturation protease